MNVNKPIKLLVIRFSSLGDVAMTAPVLKAVLSQNENVEITVLSRPFMQAIFSNINNVKFIGADLNGKHKGFLGLYKLYKSLKPINFKAVVDLHHVLRSQILGLFFKSSRTPVVVLNKNRKGRKALTRKEKKVLEPLKPMVEAYADVFRKLGLRVDLSHETIKNQPKNKRIGIAPFAQYSGKMYPLNKMENIVKALSNKGFTIYLFGGKEETRMLKNWENLGENIHSIAGKFSLSEELNLIKTLDLMISMDSANMHLASLVGVRVISIWGATHPFAGFLGYKQSMDDVIEDKSLAIRPSSIFGKDPHYAKGFDYFKNIPESVVLEKIYSIYGLI